MENNLVTTEFLNDLKGILAEQNQTILGKVGEVSRKVDALDSRMLATEESVHHLMNERPINRREAARMRRTASRRICELLNVPTRRTERTIEQQVRYQKYANALFKRLYAEVPFEGHMSKSSYLDTPIKDYDAAMADIECFVPNCGMVNFFDEVDKIAVAKRIAKEMGYTS